MLERIHPLLDRRAFLSQSATALSGAALAQLLRRDGLLAAEVERARPIRPKIDPANPNAKREAHFEPRAKQVLMIFSAGGRPASALFFGMRRFWR